MNNINRRSAILGTLTSMVSLVLFRPHSKADYTTKLAELKPVKTLSKDELYTFDREVTNGSSHRVIIETWRGGTKAPDRYTHFMEIPVGYYVVSNSISEDFVTKHIVIQRITTNQKQWVKLPYVTQLQHIRAAGYPEECEIGVDPREPAHFELANSNRIFTKHADGSWTVEEQKG